MIDVLIIGAGPTGLMAAIELSYFGLTCRIIDRSLAPSQQSKALAIQARTLELFDHLGIVEPFLNQGTLIRKIALFDQRKPLTQIDFSQLSSPYPFILSLEQSTTEAILSRYVASLGIKIERGIEFLSLSQNDQNVASVVRHPDRQETIESHWVIGCDGAHSTVRKSLGLEFKGEPLPTIFSLADVTLDGPFPHDEILSFLDKKGLLVAIPLPGEKRYRLIFQLQRCQKQLSEKKEMIHGDLHTHISAPTLVEVEEKIRACMGPHIRLYNPSWLTNFHVHSRIVDEFQLGQVFLAGDSAHIHSPAGGQGMNGGLQDIDNLIWKLALVQQNKAKPDILNTYTLERRFVAKTVLKQTERLTQIGTLRNPAAVWLRNHLLPFIMQIPFIQRRFVKTISQTNIRYLQNNLIIGPLAGQRAPNVSLGKTNLYALCRKTTDHHLLLFSGLEGKDDNLLQIAQQFEGKAKPIFITYEKTSDWTNQAHQIYRVKTPTVYLVRPDMYIGAIASSKNLSPIFRYFSA